MGMHYTGTRREQRALDTFVKLLRASSAVNARLNRALVCEEGLTESQLAVLEALYHLGPLPQGQLSAKLLKSGSNLTTVVQNLERAGLVRRVRDDGDRRVHVVHLTDAGRRLIRRIFPAHAGRITAAMDALAPSEQRELARLCRKLGLAASA